MMKYILGAIVIAVVGIGSFVLLKRETPVAHSAVLPATLVVTRSQVWLIASDGAKREVHGSQEVRAGAVIETGANGYAEIRFPDGSVARLDHETKLTLEEQLFDATSSASKTTLFLTVGRVWSRVAALATPASHWEVKTSNIVAAVRGTAFSVGFGKDGKSRILVRERSVQVSALDPATKNVIGITTVDEKKTIELDSTLPPEQIKLEVRAADRLQLEDQWIKSNESADRTIEPTIQNRESEVKIRAAEFQKVLVEADITLETYLERVEAEIEAISAETTAARSATDLKAETAPAGGGTGVRSSSASEKRAVRLSIIGPREIAEGATAQFKATLVFDDGTSLDVTGKASWSLKGPVGTVRQGLVSAAITDAATAETGSAVGTITASYSFDGTNLLGEAAVTVTASQEQPVDDTLG